MRRRSATPRRVTDGIIKVVSSLAALTGIAALAWILTEVIRRGATAIDWAFFTQLPTPPGIEGGGLASALVGTLVITALAAVMGIPIGILAGVYLAEFGTHTKLGSAVRFTSNVLMGIPSIIIGLFVYTTCVMPVGHFSGWSGAVSLAVIMLPVVARTTEDMLSLVPNELRESALSLGAPRWRVTIDVIFRAARAGLVTGVILAFARISGETAPLLFTAMNSPFAVESINEPTANLTVTIYNYAMSPYEDWQSMAWGASLVITMAVLLLTISARAMFREKKKWS